MNPLQRLQTGQLPGLLRFRVFTRGYKPRRTKKPTTGFVGPEGYGEKVWVFTHRRSLQVIYSLTSILNNYHGLASIPFNGKKLKPAKLRKDYWYPMAQLDFGAGKGHIGRSVYQKLRELKHLHEVSWDDELLYKKPDEFTDEEREKVAKHQEEGSTFRPTRTVHERGVILNAQKANAIADMAVVLAGQGRGNQILQRGATAAEQAALADVVVEWADEQDHNFAEKWSENVRHRTAAGDQLVISPVVLEGEAPAPVVTA